MSRAARSFATAGTILALGGGTAALLTWWATSSHHPHMTASECRATVDGHTVVLSPEQGQNAATIAVVAARRGLPARAVTIALATAYQESDIYNLDYGDRDSLGLFQQRPSQGWGTAEQIRDPVYAATAFYDALVNVPGYRNMEITSAAQRVQRSAHPHAYADHEEDARALASALTGNSHAAFHCAFEPDSYHVQHQDHDGLTDRARAVRDMLLDAFGDLDIGGYPTGSGHIEGSSDGRALDIMFRPYDNEDVNRRGWALAQWVTAYADELGVATIIYDDKVWTAQRCDEGWRDYTDPSGDADDITQRYLDHVHIDVAEGD
jgi:hypothetical protein